MKVINKLNNMRQIITVDLASTEVNQKTPNDPDYTVIMRGSMVYEMDVPKIFVFDVQRFRESAVKRNKKIIEYVMNHNIPVYKEIFGAYKDTYEIVKDILMGKRSISPLTLPGNKEAKADPLTPVFEAGNIYLLKGPWNQPFIDECTLFPSGIHDDMVDCLAMLFHVFKKKPRFRSEKRIY